MWTAVYWIFAGANYNVHARESETLSSPLMGLFVPHMKHISFFMSNGVDIGYAYCYAVVSVAFLYECKWSDIPGVS